MPVSCAVGLPNIGEYGDPELLVQLACDAEAAGWAGAFLWDHVAYREPGWPVADPYVTGSQGEQVAYTRAQRTEAGIDAAKPFDVVLEGVSDGRDAALVRPYADAGLTWWIEKLGWFRGPLPEMRARIAQGPPA